VHATAYTPTTTPPAITAGGGRARHGGLELAALRTASRGGLATSPDLYAIPPAISSCNTIYLLLSSVYVVPYSCSALAAWISFSSLLLSACGCLWDTALLTGLKHHCRQSAGTPAHARIEQRHTATARAGMRRRYHCLQARSTCNTLQHSCRTPFLLPTFSFIPHLFSSLLDTLPQGWGSCLHCPGPMGPHLEEGDTRASQYPWVSSLWDSFTSALR